MNGSDEDCLTFAPAHPLLSADALQHQPTAVKKAPLGYELWRAVAAITLSFDQVHVYDDATPTSSGIRLAHSIDSVKLLPAAMQWRRSGHIGVTTLCLVAMSINATSLDRKHSSPASSASSTASDASSRRAEAALPRWTRSSSPLSAAAHALVATNADPAVLAPLATASSASTFCSAASSVSCMASTVSSRPTAALTQRSSRISSPSPQRRTLSWRPTPPQQRSLPSRMPLPRLLPLGLLTSRSSSAATLQHHE